ncbi:ABC transporter [Bacillus coahuilensis m2-6]|uniref:ABC transporter ATP-binding protein n=1 Tax=Bacillus coahuilensis TaxID=408580 RepID=UPI00075042BD|nr:ABC transporter ATP-binding protein [Bacillus coahuilensis]KUP05020.1 ABC transporter [Bacillus coahuilensis m2-6]
MITVTNVTKRFESQEAVKGIHLHVKKGSIYGLLGSNGAGKTTLMKMLAGIYKPDDGTVEIQEKEIYENIEMKQRVIFIPDALYYLPQSTVAQMADYYRHFYDHWNEERFKELQKVFNIDFKHKVHRMSKGMQRQVAFWLALSAMPDYLILDEPIDGLDPVMRQKLKTLLFQEVADRDMTIIISSHNLREIEDLCDHVGIMHKGKLVLERELDDLKSDIHKIQVAFRSEEHSVRMEEKLQVLYQEQRGSVHLYIVRGNRNGIEKDLLKLQPYVLDMLPLTLEEIFIYEMEDLGYEIKNVLL